MKFIVYFENSGTIISEKRFEIVGAVNRPGKYPYNEGSTVLEYIKLAGGKKRNSLNTIHRLASFRDFLSLG